MSYSRVDEKREKSREKKLSIKPPVANQVSKIYHIISGFISVKSDEITLVNRQLVAYEGKLYKRAMCMLYSAKPDRLSRRFYHGLKKNPHETRNLCFYKKIVDRSGVTIRPLVNEGRAVAERARQRKRTDTPAIEESWPR